MDDNVGIPEDLRCKRSDGKQWRCTALSMPDKTVCEKHYIQAKRRAANSALRASMKKSKRKPIEDDIYLHSKDDELDEPSIKLKGKVTGSVTVKTQKDKKGKLNHRESSLGKTSCNSQKFSKEMKKESTHNNESTAAKEYNSPLLPANSIKTRTNRNIDANNSDEHLSPSTDSSGEVFGQTCHQCRRNDRESVVWCQRCDRRGYCKPCISKWYPNVTLEQVQRVCPACCGSCNCRTCLQGDNFIKARVRSISDLDKLHYLHRLLLLVLPVVKQIHAEQCFELDIEKKICGLGTDIPRAKMQSDEQMCCDCCKTPIIDYHLHCGICAYDLCLSCCQDFRQALAIGTNVETERNQIQNRQEGTVLQEQGNISGKRTSDTTPFEDITDRGIIDFTNLFPGWELKRDGSIPCPPRKFGGCGNSPLTLRRIFKLNWVAKVLKTAEEMVLGCRDHDTEGILSPTIEVLNDLNLYQYAHRENTDDNFLYCPKNKDIECEGIAHFQKHFAMGEPIIVRPDSNCIQTLIWDPMTIWRSIQEIMDDKRKDDCRFVKAINCRDESEINIEIEEFIKGYLEGRVNQDGRPEILKLRDWPPPSILEEFLLYHSPDLTRFMPLLHYIHSKWGFLNLAAKLPQESIQPEAGLKISIAYGRNEAFGMGDSVTNLHINMGDVVHLLIHTSKQRVQCPQKTEIEDQEVAKDINEIDSFEDSCRDESNVMLNQVCDSDVLTSNDNGDNFSSEIDTRAEKMMLDNVDFENIVSPNKHIHSHSRKSHSDVEVGALWDVFRRQDVPKLNEYLRIHWKELRMNDNFPVDPVVLPIYDQVIYLNEEHQTKLKEEFDVQSWKFEQHLGEAVFIPAGCPFQMRYLQSSVQLSLDFLSPESLRESAHLAKEIRLLRNDHKSKLEMLEVGKMALYSASSAIKEIQTLVLHPKFSAEIEFKYDNLTTMVSQNVDMIKRRRISCS